MKRMERVRLYPTTSQTIRLMMILDVTRQLYNAALEHRRDAYRKAGVSISAGAQRRELTEIRAEDRRVAA
ncbi:MAG: helix-turn-helix domain-containing protein, partial [Candidatus Eremiobacteraeota bacterium]|nr:helix-turn-helix domain-containing protein [Candidatus Eremiobacteraeota bacterium]